jgi:flagellar basal body-associated protein FliL
MKQIVMIIIITTTTIIIIILLLLILLLLISIFTYTFEMPNQFWTHWYPPETAKSTAPVEYGDVGDESMVEGPFDPQNTGGKADTLG